MKISVVIPVYNEEKRIKKCVMSLLKQTEKPAEIIIVDNNCTDRSMVIVKDIIKKHKVRQIKIVKEKKQGILPARNKGFNSARFVLISRLDADARAPKDWIKRIKTYFLKRPKALAVTGPVCFTDVKLLGSNLFLLTVYSSLVRLIVGHYVLRGANLVIRRSTWQQIRSEICQVEKIILEDLDISIHIARYGKIGFLPKLFVLGSGRRATKNPWSFYVRYPINFFWTLIDHKLLKIK